MLSSDLQQLTLRRFAFSNSAFNDLIAAIATSKLKQLNYNCGLNLEMAMSLAKLLTQTEFLDEVSVGECYPFLLRNDYRIYIDTLRIDCDAAMQSHY